MMPFEPTLETDIPELMAMFDALIAQHKQRGNIVWDAIDEEALRRDIQQAEHFKWVEENKIRFAFTLNERDPAIWKTREDNRALYIHRAIRRIDYVGTGLFARALAWVEQRAKTMGREVIRMDSWADNHPLIAYYQRFGFTIVGQESTGDDPALPKQHRHLQLTLLEKALQQPLTVTKQ